VGDDLNAAAGLLAALHRRGVTVELRDGQLWCGPRRALGTADIALLRTHKAALLALLRGGQAAGDQPPPGPTPPEPVVPAPAAPQPPPHAGPAAPRCPHCGSAATRDVAIHSGRSVRRDCAQCGRFISFPVWYGEAPPPPPLPGWPAGVVVPEWWAELAGPMRDLLAEAAGHTCPECGFAVAVRWRSSDDGALRWACPRCGLHAGDGERRGIEPELPAVLPAGRWDAIVVRDACTVCGFPPDGPKDDQGRCRWCAARVSGV
jgi:predicted RNA-binding Zn-ribbon protein involved in translation (DUF1610 family)